MCSENMQHIYRRTRVLKCDSTIEITLRDGSSLVNLQHIFRTDSYKNPAGTAPDQN